jgi:hypothetical protein
MATSGEEDEAALLDRMDAESGLTVSRTSPFSPSWLIEKWCACGVGARVWGASGACEPHALASALSWQQRLVGFVMFFVAGTIMSVMVGFFFILL